MLEFIIGFVVLIVFVGCVLLIYQINGFSNLKRLIQCEFGMRVLNSYGISIPSVSVRRMGTVLTKIQTWYHVHDLDLINSGLEELIKNQNNKKFTPFKRDILALDCVKRIERKRNKLLADLIEEIQDLPRSRLEFLYDFFYILNNTTITGSYTNMLKVVFDSLYRKQILLN